MGIIKDIESNITKKKEIELKTEERVTEQLEKYYRDRIEELNKFHKKDIDKLEATTEERIRSIRTQLKEEHKKDIEARLTQFNQEKKFISEETQSYKKENLTLITLHKEEVDALKNLHKAELDNKDKQHRKEMLQIVEDAEIQVKTITKDLTDKIGELTVQLVKQKQELTEHFSDQMRLLNKQNEEKTIKLRKAQAGWKKYLDYATNALHLAAELKAESDLWMMQGANFSQKMNKISDKFEEIDRFNIKNKEKIENLLGFHNMTNEELVAEVLLSYNESLKEDPIDLNYIVEETKEKS